MKPRQDGRTGASSASALVCLLLVACGAAEPRPIEAVEAIRQGGERYAEDRRRWREEQRSTIARRMEAIARGETSDETFDVLFFSGGAEWGAFGAGYAAEWKRLGGRAAIPMPEFDMIGGISTGALMAAYVANGDLKRFEQLELFYRNVSPDWIQPRPLAALLFRDTTSLIDNAGIENVVRSSVDGALIQDLRAAAAEDRPVYVGTLNLDYLTSEYWDVAEQAAEAAEPEKRVADILMAATAIPVAFPPIEIGEAVYADLGGGEMAPVFRYEAVDAFAGLWRERNGDRRPPVLRIWLIYNLPLGYDPDAVEKSLLPLALRGWEALSQASSFRPLMTLKLMERLSVEHETPRIEVRWIAIPSEWRYDPDDPLFDPVVTNKLADLGAELARTDDGAWRKDIPNY